MEDNVPLKCSCPHCNKELTVPLKHNTDENKVMDAVSDILGDELKMRGSYTFIGEMKCSCNCVVIACLTVSAQGV